jgi:phosphoglycerate dehydrogenase-like enzyme
LASSGGDLRMRVLTIFPDTSAMWESARRRLSEKLGSDVEFAYDLDQGANAIEHAEIVLTFALSAQAARAARGLRWIQALGTGVDGISSPADRNVILTNARNLHGAAVSEATLAFMLTHARRLQEVFRNQMARAWRPYAATLLAGKTIGIVGTGHIALSLARYAAALGMQVLGFTRTPRQIAHFQEVLSREELPARAGSLDYLVLLVPLDPSSHHIIDRRLLAALKAGSLLINVGRGALVDEIALTDALRTERFSAALDTFESEPLAASSELWGMSNVLISPHSAGRHTHYMDDVLDLFFANLCHFRRGEFASMKYRLA